MHYQCAGCDAEFYEFDAAIRTGPHESDPSVMQTWPTCPECGCEYLIEVPDEEEDKQCP